MQISLLLQLTLPLFQDTKQSRPLDWHSPKWQEMTDCSPKTTLQFPTLIYNKFNFRTKFLTIPSKYLKKRYYFSEYQFWRQPTIKSMWHTCLDVITWIWCWPTMIVSSTSLQLGTSNLWFSNIVTTNGSTQFCQNFKHRILFYTNFGLGRISMSWLVSSNKTCHRMARFLSSTLFDVSSLVWILQEEIPNHPRKMSSTPANPEYTKWSQRYRRLGWRHLNCSATVIFITQNSLNRSLPPRKFYDSDSSGQF